VKYLLLLLPLLLLLLLLLMMLHLNTACSAELLEAKGDTQTVNKPGRLSCFWT